MPPLDNPIIISSSLENQQTSNVSTQVLDTKFGKPEDIIEAHVYDKNNVLLDSYSNVKDDNNIVILDYGNADLVNNPSNPPGDDLNPQNTNPQPSPSQQFLFDTIEFDTRNFLSKFYPPGEYMIKYNILRPKILLKSDLTPDNFILKTISPS